MDDGRRAIAPPFESTVGGLLLDGAGREPDRPILVCEDRRITFGALAARALDVAAALRDRGLGRGDAVVTMLGAGPNHVAHLLGVALAGAVWVPVGVEARGPTLAHVLSVARPALAFATAAGGGRLREAGLSHACAVVEADGRSWDETAPPGDAPPPSATPDEVRAILFTSGTTGPPKGVMVTERMLVASAAGTAFASDCRDGDGFLMWEPLHHIGGAQLLVMALAHRVRLAMTGRFSAGRFWTQTRAHGVTKLHYLGGILEILLRAEPRTDDRDHPVELAFGGGCRPEVRRAFERRFGVPIREVYGMTEASSFTTVDRDGTADSVGTPAPWFDVEVIDGAGHPAETGSPGEIVVSPRHPGLLTPGYLGAPEATARLLRKGRLHSGDLGRMDAEGRLYFLGRATDSLRRRGENVSAWEVETALAAHPDIAESAVVGVPAAVGEHDILCFVLLRDGAAFDPAALAAWCRDAMPPHHAPRYWKQVEAFERTPSQRIRKDRLDRDLASAADTADARDR